MSIMRVTPKKMIALLLTLCMTAAFTMVDDASEVNAEQSTVITVDPSQVTGGISRDIYGSNQRFDDHGQGMWDVANHTAYPAFESAYNNAGLTAFRYPGGTVANLFWWKRAIGSNRANNVSGGADQAPVPTNFGVDEAARFAETHNDGKMTFMYGMGIGNAADAADLVEYLNAPNNGSNPNGGTDWAAVRAANGHPLPYNIKVFEIGNEMYLSNQKYWLDGQSQTGKTSYEDKYVNGDTVKFTDQTAALYDDWRDSAAESNGSANQEKYAKYAPVNAGTETVKVNGGTWTKVANFNGSGTNSAHYTIDYQTGKITFGDGVKGKIPPSGQMITVTYTSTRDGFKQYVAAMKAVDPSIQIYSCLYSNTAINLIGTSTNYDGVVMHPYTHGNASGAATVEELHDFYMTQPYANRNEVNNKINNVRGKFTGDPARQARMNVFVSEYGIFNLRTLGGVTYTQQNMGGAVFVARSLMYWGEIGLETATKHNLVGPGGNPIIGEYPDFVESASAKVYQMFTNYFGPNRIASTVSGNPTRTIYNGSNLTYIQAAASKDDHYAYVMLTNSDRTTDVPVTIQMQNATPTGNATVRVLSGSGGYLTANTPQNPNAVSISTSTVAASSSFDVTIPRASVVSIQIPISSTIAGIKQIINKNSGYALNSTGTADDANVNTSAYTGASSQKWEISVAEQSGGKTYYRLTPQSASNQALRVAGTGDMENVIQKTWNAWESQKFEILPVETSGGKTYYKIIPKPNDANEYVLRSTASDPNVIVRPWNSSWESLKWEIIAP
ncbi:RICIN domain-containing protein [Paenibacillus sp. PL2-23]|uniref:RICIN domain-containing protein n=1 Tax=Paenibacillus sp. PL2-23 TaxID=2100729 RepID=UPI0030FB52E0